MILSTTADYGFPAPTPGTQPADYDNEFGEAMATAAANVKADVDSKAAAGHTHDAEFAAIAQAQAEVDALEPRVAALESSTGTVEQTVPHQAEGPVAIDPSAGLDVLVEASASIPGHNWTAHPGRSGIITVIYRNTGAGTITVDLAAGYRPKPTVGSQTGDTLSQVELWPGAELEVVAKGDTADWTVAAPILRSLTWLAAGTEPAAAAATFVGSTGELDPAGWASAKQTTLPVGAAAGMVAQIVVTGTGGLLNDLTIDGVDAATSTTWTLVDMVDLDNGAIGNVIYTLKRTLDGSAADSPVLDAPGTARSWSLIVVDGTTFANFTPSAGWLYHGSTSGPQPAQVPAPAADGACIVSYVIGHWSNRDWTMPADLTVAVPDTVIDVQARGHAAGYVEQSTAAAYQPGAWSVVGINGATDSSPAATRSFVALPA